MDMPGNKQIDMTNRNNWIMVPYVDTQTNSNSRPELQDQNSTTTSTTFPVSPLSTSEELAKAFKSAGLQYDFDQSRSDNILNAINNETFPTAYNVTLKGIPFTVKSGEREVMPSNVILEESTLTEGTLRFSSGHLQGETKAALPIADGPEAHSHTSTGSAQSINGGTAHSSLTGRAYATGGHDSKAISTEGGEAIARDFSTTATAIGKDTKGNPSIAIGLVDDTIIIIKEGAIGYKNALGVKVECDEESKCIDTSDKSNIRNVITSDYRNGGFRSDLLNMLHSLAKAGDAGAAYTLGTMPGSPYLEYFKGSIFDTKTNLLNLADKLGHKEAMYQLGEYYMRHIPLRNPNPQLKLALSAYQKALLVSSKNDIQQKINAINEKLNPGCTIS